MITSMIISKKNSDWGKDTKITEIEKIISRNSRKMSTRDIDITLGEQGQTPCLTHEDRRNKEQKNSN